MNTKIFKLAAIALLMAGINACGENEVPETHPLKSGIYTETYPQQGRTKINVIDRKTLEIIYGYNTGSEMREKTEAYKYEIQDDWLKLIPVRDPSIEGSTKFSIINDFKFEISDLYIHPAYGAPVMMIFEKKTFK